MRSNLIFGLYLFYLRPFEACSGSKLFVRIAFWFLFRLALRLTAMFAVCKCVFVGETAEKMDYFQ